MHSLVQDDFIRAASFFALALAIATIGGILIGEPRSGVEVGIALGVAFAVFAYFFVRATEDETGAETDDGAAPVGPDASSPADGDGRAPESSRE